MKTEVKTKEKPIIFSTESVKAILEGRKTQTRRIIKGYGNTLHYGKLLCDWALSEKPYYVGEEGQVEWELQTEADDSSTFTFKSKLWLGDILYVKEAYSTTERNSIIFKADMRYWGYKEKWKSPLFMPRKYARIFLEVTNIRIERLQDISEKDCIKEGVDAITHNDFPIGFRDYSWLPELMVLGEAKASFRTLWDSINGKKEMCAWRDNPYVWVIEFKLLENSK